MWYVWRPFSTYYPLIHSHFRQVYIYNRYERHYVLLFLSMMVWTLFLYLCIPKKLCWPHRAHLLRYLWVALHNASWNVVVASLVIFDHFVIYWAAIFALKLIISFWCWILFPTVVKRGASLVTDNQYRSCVFERYTEPLCVCCNLFDHSPVRH